MYKKLSETENAEMNKTRVDLIKKVLTKLKKIIKNTPKYDEAKVEENEKIIDIVAGILVLNNKIQSGQRLPISLAQLKAGNNSENLKTILGSYCILCTDQKKLQKTSIKV